MGWKHSLLGTSWHPLFSPTPALPPDSFHPCQAPWQAHLCQFVEDTGLQKAGAVASDIASFLLWYLQGNQAQLASPANVILIHQKLLEFCQLEGVRAGKRCVLKLTFSVTAVRGQPIHADVFHRPAGKVDQCDFIGSTLQKLDPQLR